MRVAHTWVARAPRAAGPAALVPLVLALTLALAGCGGSAPRPSASTAASPDRTAAVKACQDQWQDVANTVEGMDQDPVPSALSQRWASIMAGVSFHRDAAETQCVTEIQDQVVAIDSLRKYSTRLQPYDMEYQLRQVESAMELYLHDPLPKRAKDENGRVLAPPAKPAVRTALATLRANATRANDELRPAWDQAAAIDLTVPAQLKQSLRDIDRLAASSLSFQRCEAALQVIIAAIRVQQAQPQ